MPWRADLGGKTEIILIVTPKHFPFTNNLCSSCGEGKKARVTVKQKPAELKTEQASSHTEKEKLLKWKVPCQTVEGQFTVYKRWKVNSQLVFLL